MVEDPIELGYKGWGGGSISERDWVFMKRLITEKNLKTVLEVGIGLSTLLMMQVVDRLVGYDSLERHIAWMRERVDDNVELRWWDGKEPFDPGENFDLAFVDGPQGALNRFPSVQSVLGKCRYFVTHDIGYIWESTWRYKLDPKGIYECEIPGGNFSAWKMVRK